MNQREMNLLWLKDTLEHLSANQHLLEWSEDPRTIQLVSEAMLRDLERCRRLCEMLHRRSLELVAA